MSLLPRVHGGPDALGVPLHDFSTNSNACGPCPAAWQQVQSADATHYPDAGYHALRERLAARHGVAPERVVLAGSASEFIFRFTAWAWREGLRHARLPRHAYGDYAQAAQAWGLALTTHDDAAEPAWPASAPPFLAWACEPASPLGDDLPGDAVFQGAALAVLDRAYEPLRLSGASGLSADCLAHTWQLYSPNKALGLTGVRGAYALAPVGAEPAVGTLQALCPSWPLGAHGVALLQAWCEPAVHDWLAESLPRLRAWKARQQALCHHLGWLVQPSQANFFCVQPTPAHAARLPGLREQGIKLRDATSFGLPGWWRMGVLPPAAQQALAQALS
ncbi:aminotransferase class I/II-fold pyridoxal phosphate-dependent enzyme [Curvibacter lanceolatus]|uniref:aminotransferase class I/II-fold pyridoxal phosphate-dependent enzyme n=1 Tax=Curvibacter lanceolatus TaxID=86182 RepID=UPI000371863A|nr:aminotransferase class I/II-fold pyridoxal phosphate-dependent enzyme [Curvibacter lanceolatus]